MNEVSVCMTVNVEIRVTAMMEAVTVVALLAKSPETTPSAGTEAAADAVDDA